MKKDLASTFKRSVMTIVVDHLTTHKVIKDRIQEATQMTKAPSQAGCLRVTMRTAAVVVVIQAGRALV